MRRHQQRPCLPISSAFTGEVSKELHNYGGPSPGLSKLLAMPMVVVTGSIRIGRFATDSTATSEKSDVGPCAALGSHRPESCWRGTTDAAHRRIVVGMVAERRGAAWLAGRWQGLVVVGALAWPLPCLAQESASAPNGLAAQETAGLEQVAAARDSFALGSTLARHGQWVDALVAFERSHRLHPHATTLFNIGFCERALGRFTRARKSFRAALTAGIADRQGLAPDVATEARGYLEEIERRIVRATVVIRQPSLRLTINGRPLEAETLQPQGRTFFVAGTRDAGPPETAPVAVFELLLDPGEQSIVISNNSTDHVITRQFGAGSTPRIELAAPVPAPAAPRLRVEPEPRESESRRMVQLAPPAIAYGVGVAGLVVGSVFGIATLANAKALTEKCPQKDGCPKTAQEDIEASERNSLISNVGFGVGLIGGMVGTYLLLTSQPEDIPKRPSSSPAVRASVGVGQLIIEGSF